MLVLGDDGTLLYPDRAAGDHLRLMEQQRMRDRNVWLPTQAALQLSIELADAERTTSLADVIRETSLPGIVAEWPRHRPLRPGSGVSSTAS